MKTVVIIILILQVLLLSMGIYCLTRPNIYQNKGKLCQKSCMANCPSMANDYYIYGGLLVLGAILTSSLLYFVS